MESCTFDPTTLAGAPIGMLHCPECGEMVLAGVPHPRPLTEEDYEALAGYHGPASTYIEGEMEAVLEGRDDYLDNIADCGVCGERWCLRHHSHWADCDCSGPEESAD